MNKKKPLEDIDYLFNRLDFGASGDGNVNKGSKDIRLSNRAGAEGL